MTHYRPRGLLTLLMVACWLVATVGALVIDNTALAMGWSILFLFISVALGYEATGGRQR